MDQSKELESNRDEAIQHGKARIGSNTLPDPEVLLVFHGLSAFWVEGDDCVVGFLNGDGNHPLKITLYDEGCKPRPPLMVTKNEKVQLIILNPDLPVTNKENKAFFFQPNGKRIPRSEIDHDADF